MISPTTLDELRDAVLSAPRVIAVGAQTKPRLSAVDAVKISTLNLRGITEYDPSEFTFTALAGTPVKEIQAALAERGQYLPFDPMLVDAGSTICGVVASGLSGPGRFRYGGVRDFILGVRFVDGTGRLLRMGGKVVKNAAGFDVPKFLVGSLGRFGVIVEVTFKVFPRPVSTRTIAPPATSIESAAELLTRLANSRWEIDALDIMPGTNIVMMRLAGPESSLKEIAREVTTMFNSAILSTVDADFHWKGLREFVWSAFNEILVKVALIPASVASLARAAAELGVTRVHFSAGGNVAFISLPPNLQIDALASAFKRLGLSGLTLRGNAPLWIGGRKRFSIEDGVKHALDPQNRFPSLED